MISFFDAPISNTRPRCCVTVKQIFEYIVGPRAKANTQMLRTLTTDIVRRAYKAQKLDYVTFSGRFSVRKIEGLVEHSGFMCFDIDHVSTEQRLQEIKSTLIADPLLHTVLAFRSPSGDGLKWVVEVPDRHWLSQMTDNRVQSTDNHRLLYERIREYLFDEYEIVCDATSDVARPCYLCHDADAYYDAPTFHSNPAHKLLQMTDDRVQMTDDRYAGATTESSISSARDTNNSVREMNLSDWDTTDILVRRIEQRAVDVTGNYLDWVRLGFAFANTFGESGRGFYHRVSQFHPRYDWQQTNSQYDNCLKTNRGVVHLGSAIHSLRAWQ